jgi:hypothetical protein
VALIAAPACSLAAVLEQRPQIALREAPGLAGAPEGRLHRLGRSSAASATASAILVGMRAVPAAAAITSQRSAPGPSTRKAASAGVWARGVRPSASSGRGG